jgi:hypothetical protein
LRLKLPGKQKHEVYQTKIGNYDDMHYPQDDVYDSGYEAYHIDADMLEILVNNSNTNHSVKNGKIDKAQVTLLPRDE